MPSLRIVLLLAFAWLAACGGKVLSTETGDASTKDATSPPSTKDATSPPSTKDASPPATCSWSSSFEPLDAAPMRDGCRAARAIINCEGSDGNGVMCITDKAQCDFPSTSGVTYRCVNFCKANEFAAACGDLMGSSVQPPADCRSLPSPGGIFYCCMCS